MPPSARSTRRAVRASGARNAGTPSETASIPVIAAHPDEKARRARKAVSASAPCAGTGGTRAVAVPRSHWSPPQPIKRK